MTTVSASNARAALSELIDRVIAGDEVTITRYGKPVAVLLRPDVLAGRRADSTRGKAERLRAMIESAGAVPLGDAPYFSTERARELVAEVAAGRGSR